MANPHVFALATVSALGYGLLARRSWESRDQPAAQWVTATLSVLVVASVLFGVAVADRFETAGEIGRALVWFLFPTLWATFALGYTGVRTTLSRRRALALLIPAGWGTIAWIVVWVVFGGPGSETLSTALSPVLELSFIFALLYSSAMVFLATGLLLRAMRQYEHLGRRQGLALAAMGSLPWLIAFVGGTIAAGSDLERLVSTVAMLLGTGVAAVAFFGRDPFESIPAAGSIGKESAVEEMDDGLVVLDHERRVVDLNAAAERELETTEAAVVGKPIADVLGADLGDLREADTIELRGETGQRHYEVVVSAVTGQDDERIGHILVLHDVTDRRMRRQRLEVLNRVLRHNLRNDMTSVVGRAEIIAEDDLPTDRTSEMAEQIHADGMDLLEIGEKAREVERMMELSPSPDPTADLAAAVADAVESVADEYLHVAIDISVPAGLEAAVDTRLLTPTLRNLVENGVEHNDADDPWVEVVAQRSDDGDQIAIEVRDDGPGIPDHERAVVIEGEEDSLEHGSGLGLWAVKWGVTRMGGSLTFEDRDPRGTVVRLRVPGRENSTPAGSGEAPSVEDDAAATAE